MATLRTKFAVGMFILLGTAFMVAAVIWLGMSNYLEKGRLFAAYFDESVQGLEKDSPVKYRGVSIGRVQHIGVAPDGKLIQVILKIESGLEPTVDPAQLEARLKSVGITGLMFVELERKAPGTADVSPRLSFQPPYPVIATRPSEIAQLFKGIDDLIQTLNKVDLEGISDRMIAALDEIRQAVRQARVAELAGRTAKVLDTAQAALAQVQAENPARQIRLAADDLRAAVARADTSLQAVRSAVVRIDRLVAEGGPELTVSLRQLSAAAGHLRQTLAQVQSLVRQGRATIDGLSQEAVAALDRFSAAAGQLNGLLERLADQPSQLIFSGPPAPGRPAGKEALP